MKNRSNPIMESYLKNPRCRIISIFDEKQNLNVYRDGTVYISYGLAGDKLVCELEDVETKTDDQLRDELETMLWYDYQDNKE